MPQRLVKVSAERKAEPTTVFEWRPCSKLLREKTPLTYSGTVQLHGKRQALALMLPFSELPFYSLFPTLGLLEGQVLLYPIFSSR